MFNTSFPFFFSFLLEEMQWGFQTCIKTTFFLSTQSSYIVENISRFLLKARFFYPIIFVILTHLVAKSLLTAYKPENKSKISNWIAMFQFISWICLQMNLIVFIRVRIYCREHEHMNGEEYETLKTVKNTVIKKGSKIMKNPTNRASIRSSDR